MNMIKNKFLERIDELLKKAERVKKIYEPHPTGLIDPKALESFSEWKTNVENLIILIAGANSVYYNNFIQCTRVAHIHGIDPSIGVLNALKEDLEKGFLTEVRDLVLAEVFTDFLDMAEHLLENGYKDPAASLIGAVLEDGLRKIAEKNNITVKRNDNISSLNQKLADKGIYSRIIQRQVQSWEAIRNSAVHGRFNEYSSDQVKSMLEGVRKFLSDYL
jgi:hypothetical protein